MTATRDRLDYTKHCFASLKKNAGAPYDHFIFDNGSSDGTPQWLRENFHYRQLAFSTENQGLWNALNTLIQLAGPENYDLIITFDNDCEVVTPDILKKISQIYRSLEAQSFLLCPHVGGLNNQPFREDETELRGHKIGLTRIIGNIFMIAPAAIYQAYKYPSDRLPLGVGGEADICNWWMEEGGKVGYIEDLKVNHYETTNGQEKRYPDYFKRKHEEGA